MLHRVRWKRSALPGLILAAAAVCLLAWVMYVVDLDYRSMWIDEHQTWKVSRLGPAGILEATAADVHPPLYYLWVWAWNTFTGSEDLFLMRLTAAIPATLAVAMCFRLGRKWFNNSGWAGLGAAAFLATSSIFVNYGRELRMYALMLFLVMCSWWFLDRLLNRKKWGMVGYALSVVLMAYTFYYTGFIVVAQVVVAALFYRRRLRDLVMALGIALLFILPWLPTFIRQLATARSQAGDVENAPIIGKFLGTTPTSIASISEFVDMYSAGQVAYVALLLLLAVGLSFGASRRFRFGLAASLLWFFLTLFVFFALNLLIPIYGLRYVLLVIPALALLAGAALYRLPQTRARFGLLALIVMVGVLTHTHSFQMARPPHRELVQTVYTRYLPGDRIWYDPPLGARGSNLAAEMEYYLMFDAPGLSTDWFIWDAPNEYRDTAIAPRVWDIRPYWVPILEDARADLERGRTISEAFTYEAYTVHLYEAPPSGEQPVVFGDMFSLLPGPLDRISYQPGDTVITKTWWRVLQPPGQDYSYSLLLMNADGQVISQGDAGLLVGGEPTPFGLDPAGEPAGTPTSLWTPEADYALATPNVTLPADLPPGDYEIWIGVYFWQNPERLPVEGSPDQIVDTELRLAQIGAFTVESASGT